MMRTLPRSDMRLAAVLVLALTIAGCAQPAEETPSTLAGVVVDEERPDTAFRAITTGPAADPDLNATLDAPPKLVAGEWWRLRFQTPLAGTEETDVIRVVAAVRGDQYLVGMPHEGWAKELVSYHSPALGDVGMDLSYPVHNEVFAPVKFPLTAGATWQTVFGGTSYSAEVTAIEGTRATVVLTPPSDPQPTDPIFALAGFTSAPITVVYDASVHEIVLYESGIGTYEVVEHGYDFQGWVTIPRGQHTAIDQFQLGPANVGELPGPRAIDIAGGFNRITVLQAIFPIAPGVYNVRTVAPDGAEFVTQATTAPVIDFYEVRDPDGTWTTENVIAGAAATFSMGIAYHQYDIRLPDGAVRSDHSHEVIR